MKKNKMTSNHIKFISYFLAIPALLFIASCSSHSVYLIPKEVPEEGKKTGEKVDIQIRPIFTSGYQAEDRKKYLFDFSSYFTAIEIHLHNGSLEQVRWNPDQTILKYGENKEYKVLNGDEAIHYYRNGDMEGDRIVLLEKPYERQKEDIENIKRFMIQPVSLPSGGEVSGILLFKKVPEDLCENVQLIIGGIQINQQEKIVKFPLECPKD